MANGLLQILPSATCLALCATNALSCVAKEAEPVTQPDHKAIRSWILIPAPKTAIVSTKGQKTSSWSITADEISAREKLQANGDARVSISGQDAELTADEVIYDKDTAILEARGHVRILRHGTVTTGACFRFKIASPEYLVTDSNVALGKPQLVSRTKKQLGSNATDTVDTKAESAIKNDSVSKSKREAERPYRNRQKHAE
jgi:lipopolysaccharide assembly outer membrane protein LptD (OstA)